MPNVGTWVPDMGTCVREPGTCAPVVGTCVREPGTCVPVVGTCVREPGACVPEVRACVPDMGCACRGGVRLGRWGWAPGARAVRWAGGVVEARYVRFVGT